MKLLSAFCPGILHVIKFLVFYHYILALHQRYHKYKRSILFAATGMISLLMNVMPFPVGIKAVLYLMFIYGMLFYLYAENLKKLAAIGLWSVCIIGILDEITRVAASMLLWFAGADAEILVRLLMHLLSLGFLIVVGKQIRRRHSSGMRNLGVGFFIGFSLLCMADLVMLIPIGEFATDHEFWQEGIFQVIFLFAAFSTLLQIAMVMLLALSRNVYQEKERIAARYLEEQKKHYEYLQKREADTKKFRHDLKNHLYMIHTLLQSHEEEKLSEYLNKMDGAIEAFGNAIYVNNSIVDAVLNKYAEEARQAGIFFQVKGHFPSECAIDAYDLCTIVSNLLSNAMEAVKRCNGRVIRFSCGYTNKQVAVCIQNDSEKVRAKAGQLPETSKADADAHGFGLKNVQECVTRNGGEMLLENEGNTFKALVFLNNE